MSRAFGNTGAAVLKHRPEARTVSMLGRLEVGLGSSGDAARQLAALKHAGPQDMQSLGLRQEVVVPASEVR